MTADCPAGESDTSLCSEDDSILMDPAPRGRITTAFPCFQFPKCHKTKKAYKEELTSSHRHPVFAAEEGADIHAGTPDRCAWIRLPKSPFILEATSFRKNMDRGHAASSPC